MKSDDGEVQWLDFSHDLCRWKVLEEQNEALLLASEGGRELKNAKQLELANWQNNEVYVEVDDEGQAAMSVRWVVTRKEKNGAMVTKARLVVRGYEEANKKFRTDSPTCAKETLRIALLLIASESLFFS